MSRDDVRFNDDEFPFTWVPTEPCHPLHPAVKSALACRENLPRRSLAEASVDSCVRLLAEDVPPLLHAARGAPWQRSKGGSPTLTSRVSSQSGLNSMPATRYFAPAAWSYDNKPNPSTPASPQTVSAMASGFPWCRSPPVPWKFGRRRTKPLRSSSAGFAGSSRCHPPCNAVGPLDQLEIQEEDDRVLDHPAPVLSAGLARGAEQDAVKHHGQELQLEQELSAKKGAPSRGP